MDRIAIDLISQHIVDHLSIPGPPTPEVQLPAITQSLADSRKRFVSVAVRVAEQFSNNIISDISLILPTCTTPAGDWT